MALAYLLLFANFLIDVIKFSNDTTVFYTSERAIFWTKKYHDNELFVDDKIADYMESNAGFEIYKMLQIISAEHVDPQRFNRYYPLILWLLTSLPVYYAARAIAGLSYSITVTAIYLMSQVFLDRMVGGLAHTFAFPLLWCFLAAMLNGKVYLAAVITVASAALYPLVTPLCGLSMAIWMLFPNFCRAMPEVAQRQLSLVRCLLTLSVTGFFSLSLLAYNIGIFSKSEYGEAIGANDYDLKARLERQKL